MSRWLAAAALLGCWGCAFSLDGPDPNRPRNRVPRCDTSKGLVALDGVMATTLGIVALALAADSEGELALLPLGLGGVYLGGAVSGNRAVDKCRSEIETYELAYRGDTLPGDDDEDDDEDRRPRRMIPRPTTADTGMQPAPYPPQGPQPVSPYNQPYPPPQQQPAPPPQPAPVAKQPGKAAKPVPASADEDETDWTDFWREVP